MAIGSPVVGTVGQNFTQNLTVPAPATINDGDVLVLAGYLESSGDSNASMTVSGFTKVTQVDNTTNGDVGVALFWKVASSESGDYTLSIDGGTNRYLIGVCIAWPGVDNTTPMDQTATTNTAINNDAITPASIVTQTDGAVVGTIVGGTQGETSSTTQSSGYTKDAEHVEEGGTNADALLCVSHIVVSSAGTESPGSHSGMGSSTDSASITFALRPEASGGGGAVYFYSQQ